jgi:hypothetical protein
MIWWGTRINDNYGWELSAFHMLREFSDGLTFFEFTCNWDRFLGDHSPRFDMMLVILNFKVFEFNIYYLWHRDEPLPLNNDTIVWTNLNSSISTITASTGIPKTSQTSETQ